MTELRRSILSGALEPGREFSLRELAEMLQVSIIPVREALRSLENQGLVQMRPGRSAVVAPLDLDELQSIYRLRRRLEPEIAQRSCRLLSAAELDRLEERGGGIRRRAPDDERHLRLAPRLPSRPARAGRHQLGYPHPAALCGVPRSATSVSAGGMLDPDPHEHARREQYHSELVAAFRQRDPEIAASAVHQHLSRNEQTALLALGSRYGQGPVAPVS